MLHSTIWASPDKHDAETGKPTSWGWEHAEAKCRCRALIVMGVQPDGETELFWLNEGKLRVGTVIDSPLTDRLKEGSP